MVLAGAQAYQAPLIFWDLGGQAGLRSIWDKYYAESHALVFVVDSGEEVPHLLTHSSQPCLSPGVVRDCRKSETRIPSIHWRYNFISFQSSTWCMFNVCSPWTSMSVHLL